MRTEQFKTVYTNGVCGLVLLAILVLAGCSNAQVRRTPVTPKPVPWFCQLNETRDDWQCVQSAELAAHPNPARLPSDPLAPDIPPGDAAVSGAAVAATADGAVAGVLALPEEGFVVQLIATASRDEAEAFVTAHGLEETMTLQLAREADVYYVVLLGAYGTLEAAQSAAENRPSSLTEIKPWIRPLLSIQAGLLAAQALRAGTGS